MRTRELGALSEPVLVFGGPVSNLHATQAMLEVAKALGIPPARIICTGDLAAYCAQPAETIDCVMQSGVEVVMGNCEESLADNSDDCGCGFDEDSTCDVLAVDWYRHSNAQVTAPQRSWMSTLPSRIAFSMNAKRFVVVHGALSSINRFVFPATRGKDIDEELALTDADVVIGGHSGVPFTRARGDRLWHNCGSIGMPANDGTSRTWYSTITPTETSVILQCHPLRYDVGGARAAMTEAGLGPAYSDTLESGIWPSNDVMPAGDQARQGVALDEDNLIHELPCPLESRSVLMAAPG
ncbi:MAG: metallophosphatase family protein [Gammaproteobacteria bacterium]|nr:metallophosphatase family protein [Gammaproteobacteria bacterium]